MKKLLMLCVLSCMLFACGSKSEPIVGTSETAKDENGDYASAKITMDGDKIVSIELDETKEGKSKKEIGADYGMKAASKIKKEWNEQIEFLEKYIEKNGIEKVELDTKGYAANDDVLAGCTMNISNVMKAAVDAKANAEKAE